MNICVYGASSNNIDKIFINSGEDLGRHIANGGHTLIFGGGASGMMGAVARGVKYVGGKAIGIAPKFFDSDGVLFTECDDFLYPETMRERKKMLEEIADGFVVTPGGIGTFDEFFEIITLRQLGRHQKPIVILNIDGYFNPLNELLENAVRRQFMTEQNKQLFLVTDSTDEALKYLENYTAEDFKLNEMKSIEER